ncbi:DUF4860 domain-containing protein [Anaerorhabdus sp.]|jgi:apolipoprotein N-acyltransferase|uniref:DUF4860 domain-containing protein n=1 Tax=Anaerorhabdus sp. TaxID=1872524 RepID=UPI002FC98450
MKKTKVIEFLWTLTLLTAVVVGCFYLLLLGSRCYQMVISNTNQSEDERLPIAYIATSIRQADKNQVTINEIDGIEYLAITYDEYIKMIYEHEGELKELIILPKTDFEFESGEVICKINDLDFNINDNAIEYSVKVNNKEINMKIAMR